MNKKIEYTDTPKEIEESLDRAIIIPNFELTPKGIAAFTESRKKKTISIYLTMSTIEKFKKAALQKGSRYQTMISNVLDTYSQHYL